MKKILVSLLVAAMVGATLTGCGSKTEGGNGAAVEQTSNVSAKEVVDKMLEQNYIPMPMVLDEAQAKEMYNINLDDIESYEIAETGRMPGVGFIVVAKAKEGKVDAVKAAVEKIKEDKVGAAFYPEEKEIAEKATVEVNGDFVSLFILNEEVAQDAENFYKDMIK